LHRDRGRDRSKDVQTTQKNKLVTQIQRAYRSLRESMDERQRRTWAASEARKIGFGGVSIVSKATSISRSTIHAGLKELSRPGRKPKDYRVRSRGGGRKPLADTEPGLEAALNSLIDPETRGDPETPLRWTCKSTRRLASALVKQGHKVSHSHVARMLKKLGYSLQGNRKTVEGKQHPDRDAQFQHIHDTVQAAIARRSPVISVDTKKKELVGRYKNGGKEWRRRGNAERVKTHDFPDKEKGKVIPYGVYDVGKNVGWVNVGIDHDTAEFAVASIRRWWQRMGSKTYLHAKELIVTADAGGSNSYRNRLWRFELQKFADASGLAIKVCHFPPGTSKWNKIEHRMFCHISANWRGRPLVDHETIVSLISNTTTESGLVIKAALDRRRFAKGKKIDDAQMNTIKLRPAKFHGEWNYTILPRRPIRP